jgi:2-methylcitrate dehydratase
MVLSHGSLEVRHYDEEQYKLPAVRDLMSKIKVLTPETFEEDFHHVPSVRVEVELESSEVLSADVALPLGHPQNPMTEADYERKFRSLASPLLSEGQIAKLLHCLRNLEQVRDIGDMLAFTVLAPAGGKQD